MKTKSVMIMSAAVMGITGIVLLFAPHELAQYLKFSDNNVNDVAILFQVLGALYFAFAMTNWTAKANLIGGIYARPIAIGNLIHFGIAALVLIKAYAASRVVWLIPVGIIYTVLALLFAKIFFTHPVAEK